MILDIKIIKQPITREELRKIAEEQSWDLVKAVVDVKQGIMAVGGEFHADEEIALMEKEGSRRQDTWGINFYPEKTGEEFIEFDSLINFKPAFGNRSRGVADPVIGRKIKDIVSRLISDLPTGQAGP